MAPYVWQDLTTGKYHTVSNSGKHIHCTADGTPIRPYKEGVSGVAKTSVRVAHEQRIAAHEASLADATMGARPPPLDPALLQERVQTKGRFGAKQPTEIDLFLMEQQRQRLMFPEREAAAREDGGCRHGGGGSYKATPGGHPGKQDASATCDQVPLGSAVLEWHVVAIARVDLSVK